jgi:hypothetical protein
MTQEGHLFQTRQYNALADCMLFILMNTKPEHLEVACSVYLRLINQLAMKSSNIQVGRMIDAAGIPRSTTKELTRRD